MPRLDFKEVDQYALIIGILFAFFIQVTYDMLHELIKNSTTWLCVQSLILIIVGIGTALIIIKKFLLK